MKNYIVEMIGTFFLVLTVGLAGNPIAIGAVLIAMVYMGGYISGAHYNPAVTLAAMMRKKITPKEAAAYMGSQFVGAILAALIYYAVKGSTFAPAPSVEATALSALLIEVLFTFALAMVVLNVATVEKTAGNDYYGLAIGLTVMAAAFAGGGISGGAFNPAVGLGPILVDSMMGGTSMVHAWLYIIGPFGGAALAALVSKMVNE